MDITDSLCLHLKLTQHYKSTIVCSIQLLKIQNKRNKTWLNKKRGKWTACCYCGLVTQLCLTLCDPMDGSTPGFPVLHHLQELAQTHVHWVIDAIQPFHSLSLSSAFNLSQHQGLFQRVSSLHQVTKVLELQLQYWFFQWMFRTDFL